LLREGSPTKVSSESVDASASAAALSSVVVLAKEVVDWDSILLVSALEYVMLCKELAWQSDVWAGCSLENWLCSEKTGKNAGAIAAS